MRAPYSPESLAMTREDIKFNTRAKELDAHWRILDSESFKEIFEAIGDDDENHESN